jgi:multisubunit Na+/H+ antiporter MnhC subunit
MNGMITGLYFVGDIILEGTFDIIFQRPMWQIIIMFFVLQLAIFLYDYALTLAIGMLEKYLRKMGI